MIKAVVLSEGRHLKQNISHEDEHIFGLYFYNSYITKIFKGEKLLRKILVPENQTSSFNPRHQKATLFTSSSSGTCGVTLKKGTKYLLTGSVIQGKIKVSTCDWVVPFFALSRQQKIGIKGGYDCSCKLDKCPNGKPFCEMPANKCEWNGRFTTKVSELACDVEHRMCKSFKGKCLWFEDADYEPCIMENAFKLLPMLDLKYRPTNETTNEPSKEPIKQDLV